MFVNEFFQIPTTAASRLQSVTIALHCSKLGTRFPGRSQLPPSQRQ